MSCAQSNAINQTAALADAVCLGSLIVSFACHLLQQLHVHFNAGDNNNNATGSSKHFLLHLGTLQHIVVTPTVTLVCDRYHTGAWLCSHDNSVKATTNSTTQRYHRSSTAVEPPPNYATYDDLVMGHDDEFDGHSVLIA